MTCKTLTNMIKGKAPEEIRRTFNIKNDFTPQEIRQDLQRKQKKRERNISFRKNKSKRKTNGAKRNKSNLIFKTKQNEEEKAHLYVRFVIHLSMLKSIEVIVSIENDIRISSSNPSFRVIIKNRVVLEVMANKPIVIFSTVIKIL